MPYHGLAVMQPTGPKWTGKVRLVEEHLEDPLHWKRPRRVFVNSMSDLFHEGLKDEEIDRVFGIMRLARKHTFQVLTKRAERMHRYSEAAGRQGSTWPLPNVWLGVSVENQEAADERIPELLKTPAAVRFLSVEPQIGPVDLSRWLTWGPGKEHWKDPPREIDWVIIGGESGGGARPFNVAWMRSLVKQCRAAQVPVFCKQLGAVVHDRNDAGFRGESDSCWPQHIDEEDRIEYEAEPSYQGAPVRIRLWDRKGGDMAEWPPDLRIREFPGVSP